FGFDASLLEVVPSLLAGATLHVIPEEIKFSPHDINEYFEANNITLALFTTQLGEQFIDMIDNRSLRFLILGGEKLTHYTPRNFKLINGYGPTEYTVYTTTFIVDKDYDNIPIGKPLSNTSIYILDKDNNMLPIGVPGELCISGDGLARGYINNQEITDAKFIDNPFIPGQKMYKTGDLVKWLPDGNIEFVGRVDFQVKLRGYRIELSEIELQLLKFTGIREAAVALSEDSANNKFLCSYFVADIKIDANELKAFMSGELPYYMIPSFFIQIEKMPITPNGKIDKKKLPKPILTTELKDEYAAPTNANEELLVEIWKEVLGIEKIGINNNFFSLGGHSLKAVFLQSKIEKKFNISIPLNDIFKNPTIKELALIIPRITKSDLKPIKPLEKQKFYELSSTQQRLFFIEQMPDIETTYNVPLFIKINGNLNKEKLSKAIDKLVNRHEALRTSFDVINGEPVQIVHDRVNVKKIYRESSEEALQSIISTFVRPFKLNKAPLFRVELISTSEDSHYLLLDFHHIIIDGISVVTILEELTHLYEGKQLEPLKLQYKDFAKWQNDLINTNYIKKQEDYWLKVFKEEPPTLDMPTDYPAPSVLDYNGDESTIIIDRKLTDKIYKHSSKNETTLFTLLMAAYNILLAKYTSQQDIIIGAPVAGRHHNGTQDIVGMFVNTVPVRNYPADEKTFNEFLQEVNNNCLSAFENQDYQLDKIIDKLNLKRDTSRHPLFDVSFVLQNLDIEEKKVEGITINLIEAKNDKAKFDILLEATEKNNTLVFKWNYRTSLFKKDTIDQLARHFINLLTTVIDNPDQKIKDINILSKEEEYQQLFDYNDTHVDYPRNICIHQMFEDQVKLTPENVAVIYEENSYTYKQVNEKANQIANLLREKGVGPDTIVGIMLDRSPEMITSLLGILKAGGCYLPINPDYPADRTNYILENSQAPFVISTPDHFEKLDFKGEIINILNEDIYKRDPSNLNNLNKPEDLAYIIYTSGSTGKPKGVMIMHKCVIRLMKNDKMLYDFNSNDIWTMFHSFCFDFSVWEIYGAILFGGKLVIVPKKETLSPQEFLKLLKKEHVTILNQTPGAFYNLIEEDLKTADNDLKIRYVIFGGEALNPLMLKEWHHKYPNTKLINMYGITETTVHVTFKEIGDHEIENNISNIGTPIPTLTTYIMDRNMKLVPIGVVGEICVGGEGVARGYVKNPELTARRFVENPYPPHDRVYRSGDLAKLLPNGEMVYYGRMDFQVKVRGFRIELGEIENQLLKNDNIKKVIVIARDDKDGSKYLVAYLLMEKDMTIAELRDYVNKDLPDYMVPSYFIKLDEFPLTSNGKVDRKALPDPTESIDTGEKYVAPETEKQKKLCKIWQSVLSVERIGINDNFFALGGHSLKAVSLVAEMQKYFNVTVNDIFEHQTITELSENISEIEDNIQVKLSRLSDIDPCKLEKDRADFIETPEIKHQIEQYNSKNAEYLARDLTKTNNYKCILLTGVTGYLGIYLLADLLKERECKIFCLSRGETDHDAERRVVDKYNYYFGENSYDKYKNRVVIYKSDITQHNLGLDEYKYSEISNTVDCIIHSAAIVRHYGHYQEFYDTNVQATLNLINMAKTGTKKDFNHISTVSVGAGSLKDTSRVLFTEYDCDLGQEADNYYVKTKLEAEKQVINARKEGLNTNIFRIGNITINTVSGILQDNIEENAFYNVVKSFVNLGKVPEQADEVEFSFVDYVSKSILYLFDRTELKNEIYHIQNSHTVKLSNLLTSEDLCLSVDKVTFKDFISYLCKNFEKPFF
ncbi:MAG: amino acid adenylation domain-containing protein, partial [Cyanobacteriota bacterium]